MRETKFGCFLPQESADFEQLVEVADQCESLGYDSVWAYDHLSPFWVHSGQALECWTVLAAVAEHTHRIRIGSLVSNITFRNPALLAKTATTVDIISDGRLIMGLGIGDMMSSNELLSYGFSFAGLDERVARLRETILILKAMWTGEQTSFAGRYYRLSHAINRPGSKQARPPIWIGGKHHKLLDLVAELADGWNYWGLNKDRLAQCSQYLSVRCAAFGRTSEQIVKSWSGTLSNLCRVESNQSRMLRKILTELRNQSDPDTRYYIASFGSRPHPQSYEAFAEAVANLE